MPQRNARRSLFLAVGFAVAGLIGGGAYLIRLALSDYVEFRHGGLKYWILVPQAVREFPVDAIQRTNVRYTYSARDGTSPEFITIEFETRGKMADYSARFQDHCTRENDGTNSLTERSHDGRVSCIVGGYSAAVQEVSSEADRTFLRLEFSGNLE